MHNGIMHSLVVPQVPVHRYGLGRGVVSVCLRQQEAMPGVGQPALVAGC